MRRKIYLASFFIVLFLAGIFIWRLDIPNWKKLDITKLTDIPGSTIIYDRFGSHAGTLHSGEDRQIVPIERVPEHVVNAFIAAEDARFYSHHGIDVRRMFGALFKNIRSMSYAQGASTITQQLIKLTHLSSTKSISRKVQEIILAMQLERRMDKDSILESYLNVVYFGKGAYGVSAAAKTYFGKDVSELSLSEGALLAGIIKSPSGYAPHLNPEKSVSRRNSILGSMENSGMISHEQAEDAKKEPLSIIGETGGPTDYGWYMDSVLSEAANILKCDSEEVLSGGYRIYTGLDPAMQTAAESLFASNENFPAPADDGTPVQAAFTVLDTETGSVLAVIGGRQYEVRRGLNRATQIKRQPGSAIKPVSTYAAAIDAYHMVPSSFAEDTSRTFSTSYIPGNAGGAEYGTVTLREALSRSLNIATVDLADLIGIETVRNYALRFGLQLSEEDTDLAMSLGALTHGVSPASLTGAYCALANGGMRTEYHFITKIESQDGRVIYQYKPAGERVISAASAYMVTDMLKTAASSGSAKALSSSGVPIAGKTGTVEDISGGTKDIWTVAYTPEIAVSAWMGFDNPGNGHAMPSSEGGSGYPARLCAAFIKSVSENLSGSDFIKPDTVKIAMIDRLSLEEDHAVRLSTEKTPPDYILPELFHGDDLPEEFSDFWTVPEAVTDLRVLTADGESPVIAFTPIGKNVEYVLYRHGDGQAQEIAVLSGEPGREIRYADMQQDPRKSASYSVIPRNAILFKNGTLLTGPETPHVDFIPGGFLNRIMGVRTDNAVKTPTDHNASLFQSLFG